MQKQRAIRFNGIRGGAETASGDIFHVKILTLILSKDSITLETRE